MLQSLVVAALLASSRCVLADFELGIGDDSDLTTFVTVCTTPWSLDLRFAKQRYQRPEIKAPRFNVTIYDPESLAPGYWFVAPYAKLAQEYFPSKYYQPCQTGPAIYDGSGVCMFLFVKALR